MAFPVRGKANWFACNRIDPVYCAPNCPSFCQPPLGSSGACEFCSWDQCHCAWTDIGTGCHNDTCKDVGNVSCSVYFKVTNLCNNRATDVKVVDCSVGGGCGGAGDCLNLSETIIELTPRVWASGLCKDMCSGAMSVEVTTASDANCPSSDPNCPSW